ncbi:uncharacterized protein LOC119084803 [Bradysia coprophila]|uniref:uncharacterized protein LOC119084803 n=1 Tax=Bradysia coprophila TaxID=38358 RepID=UPI00187D8DFC|nr:uncharacterized protein LOC119084803 [Bradysia coprophila]
MKMKLVWLAITFCATATHTATGIQIDNQLISSKNDCFERIVLEAMIPFDRTFRTTDTNKKQICEKLCIAEGDKCQTYSLGISVKGNGTCQLSSNKIDLSTGRRPSGTLYDPDFDIYQRKENCGNYDTTSSPPLPGGFGPNIQIASTFPPNRPNNDRPTTPNFSTSNHKIPDGSTSTTPDESSVPPTGTQNQNGSERPIYSGYGETTNQHYPPEDIYPSTERYPNKDRFPTSKYPTESTYGTPNTYPTNDKYGRPTYAVHPHEDTYSTSLPTHSSETYNSPSYPTTNHDHFNFHHDIYPTYSYPMLYENNYPQPNDYGRFPNIYAQNIPTILTDYYGPGENYYQHIKPDPSNRPPDKNDDNFYLPDHSYNPIPTQSNRDRPMHYGNDRDRNGQTHFEYEPNGTNPMGYGDRDRTPNGYSNRPMNKPNEYMDRDKPLTGGYESMPNSLYKPSSTQNYGYGNNDKAEGNYHVAKEPIETYFNPDDYLPKRKPGDVTGTGGNHGSMGPGVRPMDDNRPCFRRALAGKRVSQRWVRRTLTCERVEDCQAECGHEKRFTCEGFNYKLDPSGRGQGICELMDVPLTKMDLYSNGPNRDENLIFHPDYDYYERDRNACRPSNCRDCVEKPSEPVGSDYFRPTTYRPNSNNKPYLPDHHSSPPSNIDSVGYGSPSDRYNPPITAIDKYRPPIYDNRPPKEYDSRPPSYDSRPPTYHSRPHPYEGSRPSIYENRPPDYDRYDIESGPFSSPGGSFRPSLYGSDDVDRYDFKPIEVSRPGYQEVIIPANHDYGPPKDSQPHPYRDHHNRPDFIPFESYRPEHRPTGPGIDYQGPYRPDFVHSYRPFDDKDRDRPSHPRPDRFPPSGYLDREPISGHRKPGSYLPIGAENPWGSYGGTYGGSSYSKYSSDYWGLRNEIKRNDGHHFNYFELGGSKHGPYLPSENAVWNYPGSKYNNADRHSYRDKINYDGLATLWTRRPGQDECSAKSSEGFRLHKGVIRHSFTVPSVIECERMCYSEDSFRCTTYSFRYSPASRDNCQLCDRPVNQLDNYADIEPDRDFDIYSMTDDPIMCSKPRVPERSNNAQCFFRAIDSSRFFKSIVRDSLTVRSVGECEMECIKSSKFTCRAFSFRYGAKSPDGVIDNCQLSDWPVRDMDKERHLILDTAFDIFERASYGRGCEIQPIIDDKHKKLCYLGYGSPSKLLSTAIKKVISVPTELECKNECIRFRETTPFKCYSFSFTSQQSTFNCEMSDLDQSELKLNVHYVHVNDRDFWLFAWNPFDYSCRDKVNTIGGSRVNNDRRMDIFREPGQNTWTHYTVSGKACRSRSGCQQNAVTGFYSCEIDGIERDAWDYCCNVDHPCGYSQGFDYPWCFVGDRPDQWRTCSDRYFPSPSESTNRPTKVAVTYAPSNKKKGEAYHQAPPKPGGLNLEDIASARLWPVTYLYSSGPPNTTELSNFVDCNKETC